MKHINLSHTSVSSKDPLLQPAGICQSANLEVWNSNTSFRKTCFYKETLQRFELALTVTCCLSGRVPLQINKQRHHAETSTCCNSIHKHRLHEPILLSMIMMEKRHFFRHRFVGPADCDMGLLELSGLL